MGAFSSTPWPNTQQATFTLNGKQQIATCVPYANAGTSVPVAYKGASYCKIGSGGTALPGTYSCSGGSFKISNGLSTATYNTMCTSSEPSSALPTVACQSNGSDYYCNTTVPFGGGSGFTLSAPTYAAETGVSLSWAAFPGATEYTITRADQNAGNTGTHTTTVNSFADTEISPADTYTYTVSISKGIGQGLTTNSVIVTIPPAQKSGHALIIVGIVVLFLIIIILVIIILHKKKAPAPVVTEVKTQKTVAPSSSSAISGTTLKPPKASPAATPAVSSPSATPAE